MRHAPVFGERITRVGEKLNTSGKEHSRGGHERSNRCDARRMLVHARSDFLCARRNLLHARRDFLYARRNFLHARRDFLYARRNLRHARSIILHARRNSLRACGIAENAALCRITPIDVLGDHAWASNLACIGEVSFCDGSRGSLGSARCVAGSRAKIAESAAWGEAAKRAGRFMCHARAH